MTQPTKAEIFKGHAEIWAGVAEAEDRKRKTTVFPEVAKVSANNASFAKRVSKAYQKAAEETEG